ncbi:hypothetical protein IHQ72_08920 [Mesorhizobium onobrychidis]|uniref:DUF6429 domain-containing protein n=1 Tax=Mesorhizobium onobrychidis TaxID=2775404 RepID=A0ABY5R744_9HYPH|nr:hypothetical protein IHQ72_08920 [Mesorhizobium onobrychidis]
MDTDKIDSAVLGLLWLTLHEERRAWKGLDWDTLDRLHQKGLIANPQQASRRQNRELTRRLIPQQLRLASGPPDHRLAAVSRAADLQSKPAAGAAHGARFS